MKKENIKFLTLAVFIFFALAKNIQAQKKADAGSYTAYGYLCSSADTLQTIWKRLYSIEKFDKNNRLISRTVLNEKTDTFQIWSYDEKQRLVKEMYENELTYYYYSENALTPDSCLVIPFFKNDFPHREYGRFHAVYPDSIKLRGPVGYFDEAAEAFVASEQFPNQPDNKIVFRYTAKEKMIRKDEFTLGGRIKENLKLSMTMQFNEKNQLVKYESKGYDYGGYHFLYEDFFRNKSGKLTHAFGYYRDRKEKPDYIICYRYVKSAVEKSSGKSN